MVKKIFAITGACLCIGSAAFASQDTTTTTADDTSHYRFTLMPESHLVPLFTADSRAHRLSIANVLGTSEFIGSMGGIFPVVKLVHNDQALQFSVASTLYTTLVRYTQGGSLINTDFFVDFFLDLKLNENFLLRSGIGHTSQHLSDDYVKRVLNINYVRDYGQLFAIYQLPKHRLFAYGGIIFNNNLKTTNDSQAFDLSNTPMYQAGFEYAPFHFGKYGYVYCAADIKFRGEVNYGTTQNIQVGVKWMNQNKRSIRIACNFGSGYDERGQFYTQKRTYAFAGFYFDF